MDYSTPKGMRDYLPAQMELREALLDKIRAVFRSYGFRPLDTPAIETVATLQKQGGEEIEGQIFRIQESDLGLRYDLTVPLARVCGSNSFSLPFKRYAISKVWRREEPQKGRLREFIQSDIDTIGSSSPKCEAELLACAAQCLKALGFANFEMRLNSRALLDSYFDRLGINAQRRTGVMRAIDKIGKLDMGKIQELLEDATGDKKAAQGLLDFISLKGNAAVLKEAKKLGLSETAISNLEQILEYCRMFGISPVLDMSLVRGLAYYTGAVFEISASKEIGSVAGGGRYDNLVGTYGPAQPAVGISLGFERLFALIESGQAKLELGEGKKRRAFVACTDEKYYKNAVEAASVLRNLGIPCSTDLLGRKLGKQMECASKENCTDLVIMGEKEAAEKSVTVKDLKTGAQQSVKISGLAKLFS